VLPQSSTFRLSRRLFVSGVAAVYALAFGELLAQVQGLFGSRGIVPLAPLLDDLAAGRHGLERWHVPTLLWFGAGDGALTAWCWIGMVLAAIAAAGILPCALLAACWAIYLSFASVGVPFLAFQWDELLLETGLLAVVWAPGGVRPYGRREREPSRVARWLVLWLLFRLMLLSGLLKLCSGDPSWSDGTALDFHYWTQPLPHRLSHYAQWWPGHALSLWVMFAVELGVPALLLVPVARRRCRQVAAAAVVLLMAAIAATGNYGFFNLLTALLCVPLLDDRAWRALLRRPAAPAAPPLPDAPKWRGAATAAFAAFAAVATVDRGITEFESDRGLPWPLAIVHDLAAPLTGFAAPLESFNGYGLFRVMTRERPELLLEGSDDGVDWRPYGFRYKPADPARAPVFAGLYMPRLDWQLWFAALDGRLSEDSGWTLGLLRGVLEGSPPVLALLGDDPFAGRPPREARLRIANYRFSSADERAAGIWWRRSESAPYSGAFSLENGKLRPAR
jgi:hypothetical protein